MDEVLGLKGVSFLYGSRCALKDISFSVASGECVAVLGANGSGKSTLLKILDGLSYPASGEVVFRGVRLTEDALQGEFLRRFRSSVGFVFQEPDVQLFCPTVEEELLFGPTQLGIGAGAARGRADDLLDMLGMKEMRERPPYTLSSGEKKKVAIASVLAVNPDVLLLDEPTNGLDPRSQVWLFELLDGLKRSGKTIVVATHDLSLAEDLSGRSIVLDEAHTVAADGPSAEVLRDKGLLLRANIIHEHAHRHGSVVHRHSHGPYAAHDDHE